MDEWVKEVRIKSCEYMKNILIVVGILIILIVGCTTTVKSSKNITNAARKNATNTSVSENQTITETKLANETNSSGIIPYYNNFTISDLAAGNNYTEVFSSNESGIRINFYPAIPICQSDQYQCNYSYNRFGFTETHRLEVNTSNKTWVITNLASNVSTASKVLTLVKEEAFGYIKIGESISVNGQNMTFYNFTFGEPEEAMFLDSRNNTIRLPVGKSTQLNGSGIHIWELASGYSFGASWIEVSILSDELELTDPANNVTIIWENETSDNPELKTIFIPSSSPIFEKLT